VSHKPLGFIGELYELGDPAELFFRAIGVALGMAVRDVFTHDRRPRKTCIDRVHTPSHPERSCAA
jgi:hypothetical protein